MIANNLDICKVMKKKILMSRNKMHFIPNMADDEIFFPFKSIDQRKKRNLLFNDQNNKLFIFGIFGSYKPQKNQIVAIEAMKSLNENNQLSNISVKCFGDKNCVNSQYVILEKIIDEYGLNSYIKLNDKKANVNQYINSVDAILLPSKYEGYPNIVMEAILCNKPIIISDAANNENLVKDNINGLTFENNNPLALAKKMYQLKNNYIVIDKKEKMKFISEHSIKNITEKYINIFQSLIMN